MNTDSPKGQFFTDLYIEKGEPVSDNKRFRISLFAYFEDIVKQEKYYKLAKSFERYKGIQIHTSEGYSGFFYHWEDFFQEYPINDILNSITLIWKFLSQTNTHLSTVWVKNVNYCLREHHLIYQVDEQGGIHYYHDKEFEYLRITTLSYLEKPRYKQIREAFVHSYESLDSQPSQTKLAIRGIFESLEIMYKIMVNAKGKDRLTSETIRNKLLPIIQSYYTKKDETAKNVSQGIVNALIDWVDSIHNYRHAQITELTDPPLELTILIISLGTSYLRWLIAIDIENNK